MSARVCNTRILVDTADTYRGVARSLPAQTRRGITSALQAAREAASRGNCANMHVNAQHARGLLERRLDVLLGRRR
jgi:hypothetical protein